MNKPKIEFELTVEDDLHPLQVLQGQADFAKKVTGGPESNTNGPVERFLGSVQDIYYVMLCLLCGAETLSAIVS